MMSLKLMAPCFVVLGMVSAGAARAANPVVVMETSMGTVKIELFEDKAPTTVKNFLAYVDDKFYDGTIFHRVMGKENFERDFMIQGGGFEPGLKQKTTKAPIKNEAGNGVSNARGTLAMARTPDPDSATAQFFINVADNSASLDRKGNTPEGAGYAVFGKVIEGMDVVDKIKAVRTANRGRHGNVPVDDVVIKSIRRADAK
jgi:peptidyl-prolyl cis-trans isomerase B (cyclophilin B)